MDPFFSNTIPDIKNKIHTNTPLYLLSKGSNVTIKRIKADSKRGVLIQDHIRGRKRCDVMIPRARDENKKIRGLFINNF